MLPFLHVNPPRHPWPGQETRPACRRTGASAGQNRILPGRHRHHRRRLALWDAGKDAPELRTQHRVNPKLFKHGYIARLVVDVMREAQKPMTVGQICDVLVERYGLTMIDPRSTRRLNQRVSTAITERRERGAVRSTGKIGRSVLWELVAHD